MEYSEELYADFTNVKTLGDCIDLIYECQSLKAPQGYIVFGTSCCMMDISENLTDGSELVKNSVCKKDTRLTEWLLGTKEIPCEDNSKWKEQLKWIRTVLSGSTSLPVINNQDNKTVQNAPCNTLNADCRLCNLADNRTESKPMEFQKRGADKLYKILKNHSRAFLADEPGLGKTFTCAILIDKMAEEFYKNSDNQNKPFFVIYVAPNKTLISKYGDDLVKKFNDISERKALLLNNLVPVSKVLYYKDNLKRGYKSYYEKQTNECNKAISKAEKKEIKITAEVIQPEVFRNILAEMQNNGKYRNLTADDILDKIKKIQSEKNCNALSALKKLLITVSKAVGTNSFPIIKNTVLNF